MTLTIEQVEHIAGLARLELTNEEKVRYRGQLSDILEYFQQLQGVDTDDISPMSSLAVDRIPLRADEPCPGLERETLLENAPDTDEQQFRVPPVFG